MKLLITGGAGFIGSAFIRHILSKYDYKIVNLDNLSYCGNLDNLKSVENNPSYKFIKGDITDNDIYKNLDNDFDIIVNFAAESHVDNSISNPEIFAKTNILGTINLLDFAKKINVKKFIQISTDEVYGPKLDGYFSENDALNPTNPYSISKASADMFVLNYNKLYNIPTIITRSSNNFGPHQYPEKLIPYFISKILKNEKVTIYGNGLQKRDWIYVQDNVEAIDLIMHKGKIGEIYNISAHQEYTNLEITKFILKKLSKDESWIEYINDRPLHDKRYGITNDKIKSLGWTINNDFYKQLEKTIDWYLSV